MSKKQESSITASKSQNGRPSSNEHWERHYSLSQPSKNMVVTEGADFNPKCPNERKTTHLKVNNTDY
jgi:hypothetical protein